MKIKVRTLEEIERDRIVEKAKVAAENARKTKEKSEAKKQVQELKR